MLKLNGKIIPVHENFSLKMSVVNPVCRFSEIVGNAGVNIEIPVNEYTRAIFGNPERFEQYSTAANRKYPGFEIRKNGFLYEAGTLVITHADRNNYSAWLQPEVGVMGEEQKDKFINQAAWKEDVAFEVKADYDPATDEYCKAGIINPYFWEGKGAHGNISIQYIDEDGNTKLRETYVNLISATFGMNSDFRINADAVEDYARVRSPYLFFRYFVKEVLRLNRFYIRSHPFDAIPGVNDLAVYNNYNIFDPEPNEVSDREFTTFDNRRNVYTTVTQEVIDTVNWVMRNFNYTDLVPKISMGKFLLSIQNYINTVFVFRPDRTVDIVDREAIFDEEAIDLTRYQVGVWRKGDRKHTSLKFVVEYDKNDANFGDEFHDLSDRWKDFKDPVDTYNDLLLITSRHGATPDRTLGQLRYVRDENKIYEFKWTVHNNTDANGAEEQTNIMGWEFVSSGPQFYIHHNGDEIEEIKTAVSTLQMEAGELTAKQPGNVNAMRNLWSDFTFRMFYYLGGETGAVDHGTVAASCNWEGPNGIFEKRWKKTAHWWSNRFPWEGDFDFPENVLHYIKNNITKKYKTEKGEFIIDEMETDIGESSNGLALLKVYKL